MRKTKTATAAEMTGDVRIQEFLDMIAPSVIQFETDHFICGNTFRCVWALREYPTATDEQAILSHLGEKDGVTLRIYTRHVSPVEERKIISNAANKNRMDRNNTNDLQQTVLAESNLQDVATIVTQMHRNREPLLHTAVYLELCAHDIDQLSGCFQPAVWRICIPLTIRGKRIPMASTSAGTSSEAMCWWILTVVRMIRRMPIS